MMRMLFKSAHLSYSYGLISLDVRVKYEISASFTFLLPSPNVQLLSPFRTWREFIEGGVFSSN